VAACLSAGGEIWSFKLRAPALAGQQEIRSARHPLHRLRLVVEDSAAVTMQGDISFHGRTRRDAAQHDLLAGELSDNGPSILTVQQCSVEYQHTGALPMMLALGTYLSGNKAWIRNGTRTGGEASPWWSC
jgi:hypothetical protein